MAFDNGPFVQAASFCDSVIEDKSGVYSLIRMIDTINIKTQGPEASDDMPEFLLQTKLVLMFKSGEARGRFDLEIVMEEPSGVKESLAQTSVHFDGGERGSNLVTDVRILARQEGVYWFHIILENQLVTKVPFRVRYSRIISGVGPVQ